MARYKIFRRAVDNQAMQAQMIADNREVLRGAQLKDGTGVWAQTRFRPLDGEFHVGLGKKPYDSKYEVQNFGSEGMRSEVNALGGRNRVEGSMSHKDRAGILRQTFGLVIG